MITAWAWRVWAAWTWRAADPVIDPLIRAKGIRPDGARRRFVGHDDRLRRLSEARRESAERLRRRARDVESGSLSPAALRQVK